MNFSDALRDLKNGKLLARKGNGRKAGNPMFIYLVGGSQFKVNRAPLSTIYPKGTEINYHSHIDLRTADGYCVPWLASQTDLLALDWEQVNRDGVAELEA